VYALIEPGVTVQWQKGGWNSEPSGISDLDEKVLPLRATTFVGILAGLYVVSTLHVGRRAGTTTLCRTTGVNYIPQSGTINLAKVVTTIPARATNYVGI
jgi:hypothetical protein